MFKWWEMTPRSSFNNLIHGISKLCSWHAALHYICFKRTQNLSKYRPVVTTEEHYYIPRNKTDSQRQNMYFGKECSYNSNLIKQYS